MGKKQSKGTFLVQIFKKLAPKIGASVVVEPEWKVVGQIIFKNGRKRYFRGSTIDMNPVGASDIAKDKDYAAFFMRRMGYPAIPGKTFFSESFADALGSKKNIGAAYEYASRTLGFPVIVKPNGGSQGAGVAKAHSKREFYRAIKSVFARDRVALVQPAVAGKDYRIVVLDDRVISAYERIPLSVTGDGRSSVRQLLLKKQRDFAIAERDTILKINDERIAANLKRQKLSMRSVLRRRQNVRLLDNANLSTGGDAVDVTGSIHPGFKDIAIRLTKDMGLRFCGVDLMVEGDISAPPSKYWILEINAAPGLDHYVKTGKAQRKIVEEMYLEVLRAMEGETVAAAAAKEDRPVPVRLRT